MRMSESGKQKLIAMEGVRLMMYPDSAGCLTIGVGHLLSKSELATGLVEIGGIDLEYEGGLTVSQATDLFRQDLEKYEKEVSESVKVPLTQNQYDALVSFCFNIGRAAFRKSTLVRELNNKNYERVPEEMVRWVRAGNYESEGLRNRRKREIEIWNA